MLYRTDDLAKWGLGKGSNLTAPEYDNNFWELRQAINDLIANPAQPNQLVSITGNGSQLTFNMSDGTVIGPVKIPVSMLHWRADWTATTYFEALDIIRVAGNGVYFVLENHISGGTFDATLTVGGNPVYQQIFAFAPPQNFSYDIGFYYPGLLNDISSDVTYIYQEPVVRAIFIPIVPPSGSAHQAYMQTPAAANVQDFTLYVNDEAAGTVHFEVGANLGTLTWTADKTLAIGDRLAAGKPALADGVASGLAIGFAAQQIPV